MGLEPLLERCHGAILGTTTMNEKYYNIRTRSLFGGWLMAFLSVSIGFGSVEFLHALPLDTNSVEETSANIQVKLTAASRKITDVSSTNATEETVTAIWGPPNAYAGTNNEFWVYYVQGEEVWMGFKGEKPHYLRGVCWMPPAGRVPSERPNRDLTDLTITNGITYQQVSAVWGRPDTFEGSGIRYFVYRLKDNRQVWIQFDYDPPSRALGASLIDEKGKIKDLF